MTKYNRISADKINEAGKYDPQRALFMMLANATAAEAEAKESEVHQPKLHEAGWSIAIETPSGVVGLWSCWLKNQFYLGYPKGTLDLDDTDDLILKTLGVTFANPVTQVQATAVEEGYNGEFKDPDRPLVKNKVGQTIAYKTCPNRLWAKFYGPPLPDGQGRVWVDHSQHDMYGHHFDVVTDSGVNDIYYGHNQSMGIRTYYFSFFNQYAPEGPTDKPEAIQEYREKFLALACSIAEKLGGAFAVNINYGFVLVPEQLGQLYDTVDFAGRRGGGAEIEYRASKPGETLVLREGNSLVPWANIRRVECDGLTAEELANLLVF